ncbi:PXA domain-containing protein [Lipomyces tetrasporus]|uniref:PXA domain-containing protein n=1 Tax=Lipomyces tetrasporus TaxID=54092 RepID=A0AAD7QVI4_9ASCO|nr:PXA domain-containing protein [Lipomyces tetrasporus]KAJ8102259.1 PXA domain-containing protein [Lipomyces tetrasporus]
MSGTDAQATAAKSSPAPQGHSNGHGSLVEANSDDGAGPNLQYYYKQAEQILANATTTQLVVGASVAVPLLLGLFGVPLFAMLLGVLIGIYVAFMAINPGKDLDLEPLPWKKDGKLKAEMFNDDFRPLIQSSYTVSAPVDEVIRRVVEIIIDQYVESWYRDLSPDDMTFVNACRQTLLDTATAFAGQQALKRPADLFLVLLFSTCNSFVVFIRELRTVSATYSTRAGGIHDYIVANPESALAQMVDAEIQKAKLRNAANNLVQTLLPVLDMKRSPVALLAREIIAKQVLEPAVESFSDPDTVNRWIIYFLQKEENIKALADEMNARKNDNQRPLSPVKRTRTPSPVKEPVMNNGYADRVAPGPPPQKEEITKNGYADGVPLDQPKNQRQQSYASDEADIASYGLDEAEFDPEYDEFLSSSAEDQRTPTLSSAGSFAPHKPARKPVGTTSSSSSSSPPFSNSHTEPPRRPATTFDEILQSSDMAHANSSSSSSQSSLAQSQPPVNSQYNRKPVELPASTLFQSNIMLIDSSADNNQSTKFLTSKPLGFYTLVIEPAGTAPGWMAMRNISDFERLHAVLQKLAALAGLTTFPDIFPPWQSITRADYCLTLQSYLQLVVNTRELADCEAMKKFVDKKETATATEKRWQKNPLLKHAGEGVLDAISKATTATASAKESRKAILGVLAAAKRQSVDTISRTKDNAFRQRQSFLNSGPDLAGLAAGMRQITNGHANTDSTLQGYNAELNYSSNSLASVSDVASTQSTTTLVQTDGYYLPPPPSEIADNYNPNLQRHKSIDRAASASTPALGRTSSTRGISPVVSRTDSFTSSEPDYNDYGSSRTSVAIDRRESIADEPRPRTGLDQDARRSAIIASHQPLSQGETNSLIDTIFLAISELYLLSNAWTVRRSLLTVLRGLFLRNGSSSVEGIRLAIQKDIIDKYTEEDEIARKLNDLANAVWPPPGDPSPQPTPQSSRELKNEAKKMFVSRAVPDAIKSVMGAGASAQALEFVFDVLQDRNIARGLVLNLLMDCITTALM